MILDDLNVFLAAYTPTLNLVPNTNFFGGLMPNSPDDATALFEYPGEPPTYTMGTQPTPVISHPRIQILCRSVSYATGRALIEAIVRALETIMNTTVNGVYYERIERVADPALLHRDAARRTFFSANMAVMRSPDNGP